jgi:hypothetical protein
MQLTKQRLKDLITQVYQDAFDDLSDEEPELLSEPILDELPPISEGDQASSTLNKLIKALNHLNPEQRKKIFHRFGYYTGEHLLAQLNSIKKAEKGDL